MKKPESICIVGVGGVGGYFGGLMAYRIAQQPQTAKRVFFIARGEHLTSIQQNGLILNTSEQQGLVCRPAIATEHIQDIPTPDIYLLCVKSYALDDALKAINANMTPETIIIPLLNGVDIYERIRRIITTGIVLPACVYVGTHIEKPGVVTQKGGEGTILCGRDPGTATFDAQEIIAFFQQLDIKFTWNDDPYPAIWSKYIFIAAFGLVTASSGKTLGEVMADTDPQTQVRAVMEEIAAIANKKGIVLPRDIVDASLKKAHNFPPETKTSFQRDVEVPGKPHEGDLFGGTIVRMGQEFDVPTPTARRLLATLRE